MEHLDIEASLRKVNPKFIDQLSKEERRKAIKQFRKAYAEQVAKLTLEVSRRIKVQQNLDQINHQDMKEVNSIGQELRKRMEQHSENREKLQSSKQKEYQLQEQNWKRRLDDIVRKNKQKQRDAFEKAEKIRKQAQEFWTKKQQAVVLTEDNMKAEDNMKGEHNSRLAYHSKESHAKLFRRNQSLESRPQKAQVQLPQVRNTKSNRQGFSQNKTFSSPNKLNDEIRVHQEKCLRTAQEQEAQNYHKIIEKLQKIEKTRSIARERMQKQVEQAKRLRQLKQAPQTLAANRKRFNQQHSKPARPKPPKHQQSQQHSASLSPSASRSILDNSIMSHLETHKRIKEDEFYKREEVYDLTLKKIKTTKINRVVRDAINLIKHQTLQIE